MNVIKILPPHEAQKIAAGEVIERPAHILKEIVENAIDAGATQIFIWIEQAGKQLIRVVDNGCGMNKHDAQLCFSPHATSKISSLEDLYSINSYGFRGEALASIAAVSKVTLTTRLRSDTSGIGYRLHFQDGTFSDQLATTCPPGTEFAIRDLFYNIPVRKKFLKTDSTEWNQIVAIVQAFCLSNLAIHFKLFHDDKLAINCPEVKELKDRIAQLWDYDVAHNLISLEKEEKNLPWLTIEGFISNHQFWRHGRSHIFFFVNNRWIKNQELSKALLKGYLNVLPPGKFPAAFLFLSVNADYVDINVHPKKEEVRFIKPTTVDNHLFNSVKNTLEINLNKTLIKPNARQLNYQAGHLEKKSIFSHQSDHFAFHHQPIQSNTDTHRPIKESVNWDNLLAENKDNAAEKIAHSELRQIAPLPSILSQEHQKESIASLFSHQRLVVPSSLTEKAPKNLKQEITASPFSIVGQLFKTYILIEQDDQFIMVDQHAAHERVLYEKFLSTFQKKDGTSLLFPEVVKLSPGQMKAAHNLFAFFHDQGIILELFGEHEIVIKTSPPLIAQHDLKDLLFEALQFFQDHDELDQVSFRKKLNEFMHSHMACKAAIKAGDSLELRFMQQLIHDLMSVENRFICVHGRPTMWTIAKSNIEKNFRRR